MFGRKRRPTCRRRITTHHIPMLSLYNGKWSKHVALRCSVSCCYNCQHRRSPLTTVVRSDGHAVRRHGQVRLLYFNIPIQLHTWWYQLYYLSFTSENAESLSIIKKNTDQNVNKVMWEPLEYSLMSNHASTAQSTPSTTSPFGTTCRTTGNRRLYFYVRSLKSSTRFRRIQHVHELPELDPACR